MVIEATLRRARRAIGALFVPAAETERRQIG
jgi:hypothetical protein